MGYLFGYHFDRIFDRVLHCKPPMGIAHIDEWYLPINLFDTTYACLRAER